ncbi:MAG: cytochrome c peroxidase [Burkholderiales bacterium]
MRPARPPRAPAGALLMFAGVVAAATPDSLGLPASAVAADPPARIALGRRLFMDRRLSPNGTMSCGMCHVPEQTFVVTELQTAVGIEGRSLRRNAPTLLNVGLQRTLFHDGRSPTLEAQAWGPLLAPDEMGNGTKTAAVRRIGRLRDYRPWFRRAFGDSRVDETRIAGALAAYERSLIAGGSAFDRWAYGGDRDALSPEAQRGHALFVGDAGCAACHRIDPGHAEFTDHDFHDTGIVARRAAALVRGVDVPLAANVNTTLTLATIEAAFGRNAADGGREEVTHRPEDRYRYKTPTLRNVALTPPYMHDGSLPTLAAVIDFYDRGGSAAPGQDPRIRPLGLTASRKRDLEAFLRALDSPAVPRLAREARTAATVPTFR